MFEKALIVCRSVYSFDKKISTIASEFTTEPLFIQLLALSGGASATCMTCNGLSSCVAPTCTKTGNIAKLSFDLTDCSDKQSFSW